MDSPPDPAAPRRPAAPPEAAPPDLDLDLLAEKVYRLMLAELRLERARGAPPARQRERHHG